MSGTLEPGMRVRLHRQERGYLYAVLVEECWPRWVLRVSSGYEFERYPDEFDVEY
jgi:hypothetical protein